MRSIVQLRCFGQLTFAEIGRTLNLPETTVKTSFYRSLPRLRRALASNLEFTRLYGDPKYSGEPITCAEATGLRQRSRRGRRKLRTDQSNINTGHTLRSRGRGLITFDLLYIEHLYK